MSPRRAHRFIQSGNNTMDGQGDENFCPFCPTDLKVSFDGIEKRENELFRIGGKVGDPEWRVLVVPNKYPFSANHEVIIDSPWHAESIESLPDVHVVDLLRVYRSRYLEHHYKGQVVIFHNRGVKAGESIAHSHTQLVVIPDKVNLQEANLQDVLPEGDEDFVELKYFKIFCPIFSEWPDEVWIIPKRRNELFGGISDKEIEELGKSLQNVLRLMSLRHQEGLAYNFSIFHGDDWYLRIVPREKVLGGFEVATGVSVNTQSPSETFKFIKENFFEPDIGMIFSQHQASYKKSV